MGVVFKSTVALGKSSFWYSDMCIFASLFIIKTKAFKGFGDRCVSSNLDLGMEKKVAFMNYSSQNTSSGILGGAIQIIFSCSSLFGL